MTRNSYDETPYDSFPFPQSHPHRLATIATLFGLRPAAPRNCRVLELGCASGGNIIPIATMFPETECVAIDGSAKQIAEGQAVVEELGLKNMRLIAGDILDVNESLGKFDYIIAHGVYSWVPDKVQQKLLQICSANLTSQGVAYVSYNTYPGWRLRGMIRDLMLYRGRFFNSPQQKLQQGRALLDFLATATADQNSAFAKLLADEVAGLQTKQEYYLIHEHLEDINEPVYFYEFMERAGRAGLQYLGEAEYSMMMASNFSAQIADKVTQLAATPQQDRAEAQSNDIDVIQLEQYMDFVRNRLFRQTLLCHRDAKLRREADPDAVKQMYLASPATPDAPYVDVNSRERVVFTRPGSTLTTTEPLLKAAMVELADRWPQSVRFDELLRISRSRVHTTAVVMDREAMVAEEKKLTEPMLHCFATTHVDLSVGQFPFSTTVGEYPQASPLARWQARHGKPITNLWHETIYPTDIQRRILPRLTGENSIEALTDALMQDVRDSQLVVHDGGVPVTEEAEIRRVVGNLLNEQLKNAARNGFLLASPASAGGR